MAGLPLRRLRTLGRFGNALGICYQIADDCMGLQTASSTHSKDRLSDLRNGVPNYFLLPAGYNLCSWTRGYSPSTMNS
jgi:geranylgeranyl pyrophosphate synthase